MLHFERKGSNETERAKEERERQCRQYFGFGGGGGGSAADEEMACCI